MTRLTIVLLACLTLSGCGWLVCRTYEEPWTCKSRGWPGIVGLERGAAMCEVEGACVAKEEEH